ncbi:MAG TPA: 4-alpha-glucanotransferase, partial [Clostridia bacterium]|nr:4-alpha-glucanotransferase [Clostridia bacterium]
RSWIDWQDKYRNRQAQALEKIREQEKINFQFWIFTQFIFHKNMKDFSDYAKSKGIDIIGDIPFYVAEDSVEVWSRPELFLLGEEGFVAGTPPDYFSDDGQLWGNPIYNWELMEKENFSWWVDRLRAQCSFYRYLRLDHFNAFARYWSIPKGKSAKKGYMKEGYGLEILEQVPDLIENQSLIAEDLGTETKAAEVVRKAFCIPGMRILQVGFSPGEDNPHLPYSYEKDLFVYTGTHDNDPIMSWYAKAPLKVREEVKAYLNTQEPRALDFVRLLMASAADNVVIPVQDLLGLGSQARMNLPGTLDNNWIWRLESLDPLAPFEDILRHYSKTYRRNF